MTKRKYWLHASHVRMILRTWRTCACPAFLPQETYILILHAFASTSSTTMEHIPDEFLAVVLKLAGGLFRHRMLSKRFYELWSKSVRALFWDRLCGLITWPKLHDHIARCSTRFPHIRRLRLHAMHRSARDFDTAVPMWYLAWELAKVLPQLQAVSIREHTSLHLIKLLAPGDCSSTSRTSSSMKHRLRELSLTDEDNPISSADMALLAQLTGLTSLQLEAQAVSAGPDMCSTASQALSALKHLSLSTDTPLSPQQLQHLPGALTNLTSLALKGKCYQDSDLAAAVAPLGKLQQLQLSQLGPAAQQGLAGLQQLTSLTYTGHCSIQLQAQHLQQLQELHLPGTVVHADHVAAVLHHQGLTKLVACNIDCGPEWRGKVLQDSSVQELHCSRFSATQQQPDPFSNFPTFPQLRRFVARCSYNATEPETEPPKLYWGHKFEGLQRFVSSHSSMLQQLKVDVHSDTVLVFDEALPEALPLLEQLVLEPVGSQVLQSLARCSLPLLREVQVQAQRDAEGRLGDVQWVARLPALRRVVLGMYAEVGPWHEVAQQLRARLRELLAARPWVQVEPVS